MFACVYSRQEADNTKISGKEINLHCIKRKSHSGFWEVDEEEEGDQNMYSEAVVCTCLMMQFVC